MLGVRLREVLYRHVAQVGAARGKPGNSGVCRSGRAPIFSLGLVADRLMLVSGTIGRPWLTGWNLPGWSGRMRPGT